METREASPAHFLFTIESFSLLENCGIDKYETKEFVAETTTGMKLIIYPNGDDIVGKDGDYVSVYLAMADKTSLPGNCEVNVVFSIFLYNHNSGNYLTSLGITRRFLAITSEWGFSKFISKKVLSDTSNGYLVDDNCVFGAEVFVVKSSAVTGCLSLKNEIHYKRDWKISNFSQLGDVWKSEEFCAGDHKWRIWLFPNGNGDATGRGVSVFLYYVGSGSVNARDTVWIKNHFSDEHIERTTTDWFSTSSNNWGWPSFTELANMNDPKKGFIVKDCLHLDIEISVRAVAQ
ncbi:hypothetical protein MIMGU_mgv1a019484mg [Erythranthe guttata]|uniref:MATH domain-containing protein n=1 Tax=Erythranthe guttata TaxID=4155 RepID=A0A022RKR9_ERYGU|nr:hypothetical protein MIMGU_mgv1a019484mg [Erythranthe guttata]